MTKTENQTQGGVMNYLNLTPTGLKKTLIVKNGENWESLSPVLEQIGC